MAEYDRYINLPGFDNVNRALTLLNVPVDLYRLGDGSVDAIANPDNLPMRERIGRGIESLVGTAAYGLTPLFARFGGQKAAQAIPEIFTGFSGPQAADEVVKDVVQDPSRRNFLAGAAATLPVAALAPDVITDVATQVAKRGPGAPRTSIFTSAAANIRELKRQISDLQALKDDIDFRDNPNETPALTKELDEQYVQASRDQDVNEQILKDEYNEVFEMLNDDPVLIKNAPDDDLEFVLENVYEDNVDIYDVVKNLNLENDMSDVIADEIKTRKLHLQKDKNGIDKYPYARLFLEDYQEINLGPISMPYPSMQNPSMQMVRKADFAEDFLKTNAKKINDKNIEDIIEDGKIAKESANEINKNVIRYAEKNNISSPRRAFDNPKVEYVSTQEISDLIPRGNSIKYNVSTYQRAGEDFYDPMSTDIREFAESGQETLRESIHNDGIKEPVIIGVSKETGEVLLNEGHHRLHAALQMDLPEIPIVIKLFENNLPLTDFQSPALINTKGLKSNPKGYLSYSELDFKNRVIRPKASSKQGRFDEFDRPTSNYNFAAKPDTPEFDRSDEPLRDSFNFPPMREGFFRRTDKKAMGGPVEGIASLNNVARDMFRGPRGIGAYQQFTNGGEVNVNLRPLDLPVDGRMSYTQTDDGGMFDSEIRKTYEGGLGSLTPSFDYSTQNRSRNMGDVVIDEEGKQIGFALEGELFLNPQSEDKVRGAFEIEKSRTDTNFSLPEGELVETRDGLLKRFNLGMDLGKFGIDLNRTEGSGRETVNEGSATIRVGKNGIIRYSDSNRGKPNIEFNFSKEFSQGGAATARDKVEIEGLRNAVMMTESGGDPNAVSPDGAIGLMQIMLPTARDPGYGVENAFEIAERLGYGFNDTSDETLKRLLFLPDVNVELGNQYLDAMLNQYTEVDDALRAYNAGKTNVDRFIASGRNFNILTDEAVQYPIKVTAALQGFNPKDMNQMEMFKQSPETAVSLMQDYPAPPVENRMYAAPPARPDVPPTFFSSVAPQQRAVEGIETIQPAVPGVIKGQPKKMYQEPEGIATLTTALRPRPRPSPLN